MMGHEAAGQSEHLRWTASANDIDVTIVMPCLNEFQCLPHCIANAHEALRRVRDEYGFAGEIVIADNGSTDGSQSLATSLGARVVDVAERGYGAALIGGGSAARGKYVLMGDADGSYDFTDGVAMIGRLHEGADLCMGSRFKGGIAPGAMPWKNRYIGNPILTGILNLFFRSGISDAHCGLRAIRKQTLTDLQLGGSGMEFASEMVIKAALKGVRIAETPAKLLPDLRDRAPHLRPWRDGWRHLRYLFMLSPTWAFGVPALAAMSIGAIILGIALLFHAGFFPSPGPFGSSWIIVAGFLVTCGHCAAIMALAMHLCGVREGYRKMRPSVRRLSRFLTLETCIVLGLVLIAVSVTQLATIAYSWSSHSYAALPSILPVVLSAVAGAVGLQTMFGGFVLAIIGGHSAEFLRTIDAQQAAVPSPSPAVKKARAA